MRSELIRSPLIRFKNENGNIRSQLPYPLEHILAIVPEGTVADCGLVTGYRVIAGRIFWEF